MLDNANLLQTVIVSLVNLIWLLEVLLFIRAVISWIPDAENTKFGVLIDRLTEPLISPFRALVSKSAITQSIMIDISFIVVIVILEMARRFLESLL